MEIRNTTTTQYSLTKDLISDNTGFINLVHLALKAGKLKVGMEASCSSCLVRKAKLVICAADVSSNSQKKIRRITERQKIKYIVYGNKKSYSNILQRSVAGIICIEDNNFASGILKKITV